MNSSSSRSTPYYNRNLYVPPLSPEHVDQIYANHLQNCEYLPKTIASYLKQLSFSHYLNLRCYQDDIVYELAPHDLMMFLFGMDAPLSLIVAIPFVAKNQYSDAIRQIGLTLESDEFLQYNLILQNRMHEVKDLVDIADEKTVVKIFDHLCEKPFYRREEYFLAGCETSKLLYKKVVLEIEIKLLKLCEKK